MTQPGGRSAVALDDAVGDQLEQLALLGVEGRRRRAALCRRRPSPGPARGPAPGRRSRRSGRRAPRPRRRRGARRSTSREPGSPSAARISGRVTVPSSRSVPRALPVRSGGPATSRTSSSSWKARPISAPKRAAAPRSSRPDQAGALEQRRGLQPAALEVALLGDRGVEGVVALGELAAGERDRGVGEQLDRARVAVPRRAAAKAREKSRSPAATARSRPEVAATVGWPRRSGAASRTSSWTRVAMWTSSIAVAARTAASPPSAPAQSRTSSGRSRLPPAASVAAASPPSSSPWPATCSRSSSSTSPSRAGSQRLEASRTAVTGGGTAERPGHPADAAVDRDDPAGEDRVADPLEAGARPSSPPGRAGRGSCAPTPAGRSRPRGRRRARRAAARCGRTRASRRSRAAAGAAG